MSRGGWSVGGLTLQCPRCGFEQPPTDECISCGVIISKYKAGPAPAQPQPAAQEPAEPLPDLDAEAFADTYEGVETGDGVTLTRELLTYAWGCCQETS